MDNLLTQQLPRLLQLLEDKGWVELPNAVPKSVCRSDSIHWLEKDDPQFFVQNWLKEVSATIKPE